MALSWSRDSITLPRLFQSPNARTVLKTSPKLERGVGSGGDGQLQLSRSHGPSIPIQPFTGTVETNRAPNREMIAILEQLASMEKANKERDEKLDKLFGVKAHQGGGAGDVPVSGNSLGAGANRFLRTATTFTGQVSDMANQWTLQKQKIRSLESEKTSLESQLKDAKAEIASLKQSLQKFAT